MMNIAKNSNSRYDFAFTFAGEDRALVKEVKEHLIKHNITVFYDNTYQSELVGQDLYRMLRDIYRNKGKFVVCFISEHYTRKVWTNLEFTAIKERLMDTFFAEGFLIPILIGNAIMPEDIPSFIGFYRHSTVDGTVNMLLEKLRSTVEEDIQVDGINNFIPFLQVKVLERLSTNCLSAELCNDTIVANSQIGELRLRFAPDKTAQSPCVLLYTQRDNSCEDSFPAVSITWTKRPSLRFSFYGFSYYCESKCELTLDDVVSEICSFFELQIGDDVYAES